MMRMSTLVIRRMRAEPSLTGRFGFLRTTGNEPVSMRSFFLSCACCSCSCDSTSRDDLCATMIHHPRKMKRRIADTFEKIRIPSTTMTAVCSWDPTPS